MEYKSDENNFIHTIWLHKLKKSKTRFLLRLNRRGNSHYIFLRFSMKKHQKGMNINCVLVKWAKPIFHSTTHIVMHFNSGVPRHYNKHSCVSLFFKNRHDHDLRGVNTFFALIKEIRA